MNEKPTAIENITPPEMDLDQWGEKALEYLHAIVDGPHYRKKRHTIARLAEAAYMNTSQAEVFRLPTCASKVAHYKWMQVDTAYREAYEFLIGSPDAPGQARQQRELELDEQESLAISALAEARATLRLESANAVYTLVEALSAKTQHGPKWHERIQAANSILDRADQDTAARQSPALTLIDNAIMNVYGHDSALDGDEQAGLQADPDDPEPPPDSAPAHAIGNVPDPISDNPHPPTADRDSKAALSALRSFFAKDETPNEEGDE